MKQFYLLLVLAGVALGPGYWIYTRLYSGQKAVDMLLAGSDRTGWTSTVFSLDASMQPAALVLAISGSFAPNMTEDQPPADKYHARLYREGLEVGTYPVTLAAGAVQNSNPRFRLSLARLDILQPGRYRLALEPDDVPGIHLERVGLEVRRNVREPVPAILAGGLAMLGLGLAGLLLKP